MVRSVAEPAPLRIDVVGAADFTAFEHVLLDQHCDDAREGVPFDVEFGFSHCACYSDDVVSLALDAQPHSDTPLIGAEARLEHVRDVKKSHCSPSSQKTVLLTIG